VLAVSTIIGLIIVFGAVLGGFAMSGGPFAVLVQPNELVVIGGAALGTLVISAPGKVGKRILLSLKKAFSGKPPGKTDFLDLLKCLFQIFQAMRREGVVALEAHVQEPSKSTIFKQFPTVLARHHAVDFLVGGLRQLVDGCTPTELAQLFDTEMETHYDEEHQPINLIRTTGDALPGLGIVAAVLGIIVTMGHIDGGPEVIGHHVAAALVGTFLGILMCYGMLSPIATGIEMQAVSETRYLLCIKEALLAAARGTNPKLAIEFARSAIFSDERPTSSELEAALKAMKK
jgi:chemotaxis protein MotA